MMDVFNQDRCLDRNITLDTLESHKSLWEKGFDIEAYVSNVGFSGGLNMAHSLSDEEILSSIKSKNTLSLPVDIKRGPESVSITLPLPDRDRNKLAIVLKENLLDIVEYNDNDNQVKSANEREVIHSFYLDSDINTKQAKAEYKNVF